MPANKYKFKIPTETKTHPFSPVTISIKSIKTSFPKISFDLVQTACRFYNIHTFSVVSAEFPLSQYPV